MTKEDVIEKIKNNTGEILNLIGADLEGANLRFIRGKRIITFSANQHFAYYCDKHIKIGCKTYSINELIENYEQLADGNNYSK